MVIFLFDLTKEEYQAKLEKIKESNTQKKYRKALREEKSKYRWKPKIETSKLIAIYLFALLNAVIVYSMVAMWKFVDFSYLGVLISDIAAQVLIYAIYCLKAYHGKKQEEQVKLEKERMTGTLDDVLSAASECSETVPLTKGSCEPFETDGEAVG